MFPVDKIFTFLSVDDIDKVCVPSHLFSFCRIFRARLKKVEQHPLTIGSNLYLSLTVRLVSKFA